MRLFGPIVAVVSALSVQVSAVAIDLSAPTTVTPLDPRDLQRRAGLTGCSCTGLQYRNPAVNDYNWFLILQSRATNPNMLGWCFKDGALLPEHRTRIVTGFATGVTDYVLADNARLMCRVDGGNANTDPLCINRVVSAYTSMVTGAPSTYVVSCTYPTNTNFIPTDCLCNFQCTNGYIKCGTNCINPALQTCVSGVPKNIVKRSLGRRCPSGLTECPAPRGGFECISIDNDLEACGGCPFVPGASSPAFGVDCSALTGVNDVSCVQGQCVAKSCARTHTLVGQECVPLVDQTPFNASLADFGPSRDLDNSKVRHFL